MAWKTWMLVALASPSVDAMDGGTAPARLVWTDFDGDGFEDVYVVRPEGQDALFRNAGDGSFQDVSAQALPCAACASVEVHWRDVDGDGLPDLLRVLVSGDVELLRNRSDGAFDDATAAAGLELVTGASAARWLDYDADGRADLELVTATAPLVLHNLGDFLFETVAFGAAGVEHGGPAASARTLFGATREVPGAFADPASVGPVAPDRAGRSVATRGTEAPDRSGAEPAPAESIDPLEPLQGSGSVVPAAALAVRCASSVKDRATGECVHVSSIPMLGQLYPLSSNLFVSTGGDVGIGTTSPTARLEVAGTARVTDTLTLAAGDRALEIGTGSLYKDGLLFLHARGYGSNTGLGAEALKSVTYGTSNTAVGHLALTANTYGYSNTASGTAALSSNTYGHDNTAAGALTLLGNTTGARNTATGSRALRANTTGNGNTATGFGALRANSEARYNSAHGFKALYSNTTGDRNTASGCQALFSNTFGVRNTANGYRALFSNKSGHRNTATGDYALSSNVTGSNNTAFGHRALNDNTEGSSNTAFGYLAMFRNTTGGFNMAIGHAALRSNTTGTFNTASGFYPLRSNTTGTGNTAHGHRALYFSTSGSHNTATGDRALYRNTTGSRNIALGRYAGRSLTTGDDNVAIGNLGVAGESATMRIGTAGTHTRAFLAGVHGVTTDVADAIPVVVDSAGQLGTISSSRRFKQDVADMGERTKRLLELRPVVFRYQGERSAPGGDVPLEYGLVAEEVAEVFPDLVVRDEEGRPFTVKYHLLSSMLLNELQEQVRAIDALRERLDGLDARIASSDGS